MVLDVEDLPVPKGTAVHLPKLRLQVVRMQRSSYEKFFHLVRAGRRFWEMLGDVWLEVWERKLGVFFLFSPKEALKFQISEYDDYDYDDFFEHHLIKVVCDIW